MKNKGNEGRGAGMRFAAVLLGLCALGLGAVAHAQVTVSPAVPQEPCLSLAGNMWIGMQGGVVSELQGYLASAGYFSLAPTGYFGSITQASVQAFQSANGIPTTGFVGPLTRARLEALTCGSQPAPVTGAVSIYRMVPTSGPVGTAVTLYGRGFDLTGNIVHFGGGAIANVAASAPIAVACTTDSACVGGIRQSLTFTAPQSAGPYCAPGMACPMYELLITPGQYSVSITSSVGTSEAVPFTVTGAAGN